MFGGMSPTGRDPRDRVAVFDASSGRWTDTGADPLPRAMHAAAAMGDTIYVAGGILADGSTTARVFGFDTRTGEWTEKAPMLTARSRFGLAEMDGSLYAVAGMTVDEAARGVGNTARVERYDPRADAWTAIADLPTARHALAAVALDGRLYAMGGYGEHERDMCLVESYDPSTGAWRAEAPMQSGRTFFGAAPAKGAIYCLAGRLERSPTLEIYRPGEAGRPLIAAPGTDRNRFGMVVIRGGLLAVGGEGDTDTGLPMPRLLRFDIECESWSEPAGGD